jgi:beta-lactamase regulating signal transducer with metallopeptidase domain
VNAQAFHEFWWPAFGVLAVESTVIIGVGALGARFVKSALWQRTIWQSCLAAVLALLAVELNGGARWWTAKHPAPSLPASNSARPLSPAVPMPFAPSADSVFNDEGKRRSTPAGSQMIGTDGAGTEISARSISPLRGQVSVPASNATIAPAEADTPVSRLFAWAVLLWTAGALLLLSKSLFARALLALIRLRSAASNDPCLQQRVESLRARMNLRRRVRLFESARLSSPVAFGVLRLAIGLPKQFVQRHTAAQQDVMLVHELAHLAAGDFAWYGLADAAVALLWWQPLLWWMRRRLHAASETAADEASLLVADGPGVLAECLVELGRRLTARRPAGWLGVEGSDFRSSLARRVERLLNLRPRAGRPPGILRLALARTLAPAALVAVVALGGASTIRETSTKGETMKNPFWKKPMAALAVLAAVGNHEITAVAADQPAAVASVPAESRPSPKLKAKLEAIVLDEVRYDSLPLGAVVESLIKESANRDPDKVGVNFLMGKAAEPPTEPAIDPATGLPMASAAREEIDLNSVTVRIVPPLKKVRLLDVLDAITRVADAPIKYSIEDYAVVWTPDRTRAQLHPAVSSPPAMPQVRAFKLDTNVFFKSLERTFQIRAENNSQPDASKMMRTVLPKLGVRLTSDKHSVFYNEVTGVLLVRAPAEDLSAIQAVIETMGGKASASDPGPTAPKQ